MLLIVAKKLFMWHFKLFKTFGIIINMAKPASCNLGLCLYGKWLFHQCFSMQTQRSNVNLMLLRVSMPKEYWCDVERNLVIMSMVVLSMVLWWQHYRHWRHPASDDKVGIIKTLEFQWVFGNLHVQYVAIIVHTVMYILLCFCHCLIFVWFYTNFTGPFNGRWMRKAA